MSSVPLPSSPPDTHPTRRAITYAATAILAKFLIIAASTASALEPSPGAEHLYKDHCANCHSLNLRGSAHGSTLRGDTFLSKWRDKDAMALLAYLRTNMPPGSPGILSEGQQAAIAGYIIAANQDPSTAEAALFTSAATLASVGQADASPVDWEAWGGAATIDETARNRGGFVNQTGGGFFRGQRGGAAVTASR